MKNSSAPPPDPGPEGVLRDAPPGVPMLDMPEAPDFVARRSPVSLAQALVLLEERRHWFPLSQASRESRRQRRVTTEFIL